MDDEEPGLNLLKRVLDSFHEVQVIGAYTDSKTGLQEVKRLKPDLCFLDIQMPEMNGIQVAKKLMDDNVMVVFITAYQQYAIEAFRVNAVDYILKPVTKNEVSRVLDKILPRLPKQSENQAEQLTIRFFGGLYVDHKGIELDWPTEKTAELFTYLICYQGTKVSKWQLCDILWPHLEPEKAMHNVYNAIYRLKKLFEKAGVNFDIISKKGYYELKLYDVRIDFHEMDEFVSNLSRIDDQSIKDYEKIEALYSGEFLAGKEYSWTISLQECYHQWYVHIVEELIVYYIQNNNVKKAIMLGKRILTYTPENEAIARMLIPLYIKKDSKELLQFYLDYKTFFEQEIGTVLSDETIHCFEEALQNTHSYIDGMQKSIIF